MKSRFLLPAALLLLPLPLFGATRANISQITKTKWNQKTPYNDLCKAADGTVSASGCVPTAMAQVMKVHAWPTQGRGSHTDKYQENLTADFGATTYNWSKMYDEYTKRAIIGGWKQDPAEVQKLILHAGISVNVIYKGSAGSSYAIDAPNALGEYFRYDKSSMQYIERAYCTEEEWEDIIYNSIAAGEPVIYSGHNSTEGHTFICDGYQNGQFIFNLGWGNSTSDGSTLVSSFDNLQWPDQQSAIIGIRPDRTPDASTEWREPRLWAVNANVFYNGGSVEVSGQTTYGTDGIFVKGPGSFPEKSRIGLRFLPLAGGEPVYFYNEFGGDNNPRGMSGYKTTFDKSKLSGKYRVTLCYSYGPEGEWKPIRIERSKTQGWIYDADSFLNPWKADPSYSLPGMMNEDDYMAEINIPAKLSALSFTVDNDQLKNDLKAKATLTSEYAAFYGKVSMRIYDREEETLLATSTQTVTIEKNASKNITFSLNFEKGVDTGSYTAILYNDEDNKPLTDFVEFTLGDSTKPQPVEVGFTMVSYELINTSGSNYQLRVVWQGGDKLSTPTLYLKIYKVDGTDTGYEKRDMGYIPANTTNVSLFDIVGMPDGYYYGIIYVMDSGGNYLPITHDLTMTIGMPTGIEEIETGTSRPTIVYDLNGRRISTETHNLPAGIYVINGKKIRK